jgi:HD-like signal output (HDOD) protein
MDTKELIRKINSLPPLPNSIFEIQEFEKVKNTTPEKLIKIVKNDPLIVANILRVSNSSMFGFRSEIDTVSRAINLLGVNFAISIAVGSIIQDAIKSNLSSYDVSTEDFMYTSTLATKIINTWISSIDFDLKEALLMPAFLQEIGKFVISEAIREEGKSEEFLKCIKDNNDISKCEEKFIGYSCARVTANIFKKWSLGHNLVFSIGFVGDLESCPQEYKKKVQILEIVKILTNIKEPLSDNVIQKALLKVAQYGFNVDHFINSIDALKEEISKNS